MNFTFHFAIDISSRRTYISYIYIPMRMCRAPAVCTDAEYRTV